MIIRLQNIGFAVENAHKTWQLFRTLFGLEGWQSEADPTAGITRSVCMPFPNDMNLYLMESKDPESAISQYIVEKGPGLERLTFISDNIREEFERIKAAGIPMVDGKILEDSYGERIFISRKYALGMTIEITQPHESIDFGTYSNPAGICGVQHIGTAVNDIKAAERFYKDVLGIRMEGIRSDQHEGEQFDGWLETGNEFFILHPTQSWGENARVRHFIEEKGEGLEHIAIEVQDIRAAVRRVTACGVPINEGKIYTNREDGFEAFIFPEHTTGSTIELIEPHPDSRYYRFHR
ncbi:MAG: VOC family protein [Anaerolineaceae bacterium]|nr:VOC family protein [Anaerolineaceae bacterium]